jgi:hypothetical protein
VAATNIELTKAVLRAPLERIVRPSKLRFIHYFLFFLNAELNHFGLTTWLEIRPAGNGDLR